MSANLLLNLLNELGKRDKMRGLLSILSFFATSLINSIIQEHELSYDVKITLKSKLYCKNVIILSLRNVGMDVVTFPENLKTPNVFPGLK